MLTVISPAKSLDMEPVTVVATQPEFQADAVRLAQTSRGLTLKGLRDLMGISDDLARLNRDRFRDFSQTPDADATKPAALAFNGDTYQGLEAKTLSDEDLRYAQDHLRILSGLYGLLRPLDAIQPYRLEMGTNLATKQGDSLYEFWADKPTKAINKQLRALKSEVLVNLASNEYFKAVNANLLKARVITPVFKDFKNGKYKIVSFYAKKARGLMAAYIIKNRIESPDAIKKFKLAGYKFDKASSTDSSFVFLRKEPEN